MSDFRFAEPAWIAALWGVLALALLLIFLERRAGNQFKALVSDLLQARLVVGPSPGQRYARHVFTILACAFAVFALMRPQWGFEYVNSRRVSAELMIAIDVSRSMLAEDVAPNRLERSKAEVRDLLEFLVGDQVGLIAFAGRASVLAPMTPDFGFLRLVLDSLGPNSVGRGGTRLEEPIRKAIRGFKATGDVARVLLLITDGEDHDSFPLEAARAAAERGIRIIAIGFGSESGSEIPISDPETGARTLLRDSSGEIVRSRLDADTLREMALITDGVYVPAGLGALDLESIYDQHIAGLMRAEIDSEGRVIRSEGFQWFVLAAITCLVISVLIGQRRRGSSRPAVGAGLLVLALFAAPPSARAQAPPPAADPDPSQVESEESLSLAETSDTPGEQEAPGDPRENYNLALDALASGRLDPAKQHFEAARSAAGTDGEARYRATYGLGWVAVAEADAGLASAPETALEALYRAGAFFREAVRLQPANDDPRHNLEIVLRRARVLADSLAVRDERDLAARLDELIERQRAAAGDARGLLEQMALVDQGAQLADAFRREFRALSTQQRQLLSDSDHFAERVDLERENLEATPAGERGPEDSARVVQLQQLEIYLQRARERMGHSRRELRSRRGERAHRRANAALSELKRARDQLRDPVRLLDELLRDGSELARYTQAMAFVGSVGSDLSGVTNAPKAPPWLTLAVLREGQQSIGERTRELDERLLAGVAHAAQGMLPEPSSPEEAAQLARQERLLEQVADASPFVSEAAKAFGEALVSLETDDVRAAVHTQRQGLAALAEARERFLDLRRMIELAHADQRRLQEVLEPEQTSDAETRREDMLEVLPALREAQQRNLSRAARLRELIDDERASLPGPESQSGEPDEEAEAGAQALERLGLAEQILLVTEASMQGVITGLGESAAGDPAAADWRAAIIPGQQAVKGLENLRRLFFSIIEHLRDAARRQQQLGDETERVAGLPEDDRERALGPLMPRQAELAELTGVIANALEEQSRHEPGDLIGGGGDPALAGGGADPGADAQALAEQAVTLRRAAEFTLEAQIEMEAVAANLEAAATDFAAAREHQGQAVARLLEALELLAPPQERQDQEQQEQDPQPDEQQQQERSGEQPREQPQEEQEADPSQLLQEVRDREAARRRENAKRNQKGFDTVERDW